VSPLACLAPAHLTRYPRLEPPAPSPRPDSPESESDDSPFRDTPAPGTIPQKARDRLGLGLGAGDVSGFAPYADDPERGPEAGVLLQQQRQLMDGLCPLHLRGTRRSSSCQSKTSASTPSRSQ
jgi:hypothetical protein